MQHDGSFVKSEVESDLYSHNNCYFVSATRELDESEINTLKQKAKLYAVADKEKINKIWDELSGNVDIFEYFYRLIILIRPKLEAGLSREQRLVNRYIRKQLSLLGKKEDEVYNPLFEALKKAGIPLNEEAQKALEDDEVDVYDLDKFKSIIETQVHEMKGRVIIPSFAQSRLQQLVLMIYEMYKESEWKPKVYIDSPLSIKIFKDYNECLDLSLIHI